MKITSNISSAINNLSKINHPKIVNSSKLIILTYNSDQQNGEIKGHLEKEVKIQDRKESEILKNVPLYMSPETLEQSKLTKASNVYSFSLIFTLHQWIKKK